MADDQRGLLASDYNAPDDDKIRSPSKVQFDMTPQVLGDGEAEPRPYSYSEEDDDDDDDALHMEDPMTRDSRHRVPLLTDLEAPSVRVANEWGDADGDEELAAELRRPKSGLKSAFMNMANSIIGAGIIGQPYAMRQAGLLAGIALLVGLTVVVDWTICLIVINSKLSGTSSFQGTVEHCFGRPGLIAISLAQWVFAFGGMVAFGVIVGDTIPHVLVAVWSDLANVPVLGLLTDRRVVIAILVMGISLPLTLYRDIAKLAKASTFALIGMAVIVSTVLIQGFFVPSDHRGSFNLPLLTVNTGIFQAIGVISFGTYLCCTTHVEHQLTRVSQHSSATTTRFSFTARSRRLLLTTFLESRTIRPVCPWWHVSPWPLLASPRLATRRSATCSTTSPRTASWSTLPVCSSV